MLAWKRDAAVVKIPPNAPTLFLCRKNYRLKIEGEMAVRAMEPCLLKTKLERLTKAKNFASVTRIGP